MSILKTLMKIMNNVSNHMPAFNKDIKRLPVAVSLHSIHVSCLPKLSTIICHLWAKMPYLAQKCYKCPTCAIFDKNSIFDPKNAISDQNAIFSPQ